MELLILFGVLFAMLVIGVPVAFSLLAAALACFLAMDIPPIVAVQRVAAGISVFHAVGPGRQSEAPAGRAGLVVTEFAREVPTLLAAATLVLCRGGASTLAEVMAVGTPAMVVPYPHHTDRHQERNAALLGDGCRIVQEEDLDRSLFEELCLLLGDRGELRLEDMSRALRTSAGPPAAEQILATVLSSLE